MLAPVRLAAVRRRMLTLIRATKRPVEAAAVDSYALPPVESTAIRRDVQTRMSALDSRYTQEAAERLREFDRPALIAWSREDRFFPRQHAERLSDLLPQGRLEWVEDSYTFSPEDRPDRVAELISGFVRERTREPAAS